jgi:hypothetical protein
MGLCDLQLIHQEWREHSYDSGRTWSSLLGAARTPVPDLHDLKAILQNLNVFAAATINILYLYFLIYAG